MPPPPPPPPSASSSGDDEPIREGTILDRRYRVERRVDSGGMGRVWEAYGVLDNDHVAIKTILPKLASDPVALEMFKQEAGRLKLIEHPAIAPYRGFFKDDALDVYFIAMRFIAGPNLGDELRTHRSIAEVIQFGRRLAQGLAAAHGMQAIHCDVKPRNVLLEGGQLARARLIDFGIGYDLTADRDLIGDGFAGTFGFAAPEQLDRSLGRIDTWTDVYSLALVMLALIRRRNVDMGGSQEEALEKRRNMPNLDGLPDDLRGVLQAMLAFQPEARLRTMGEVDAELAKCSGEPVRGKGFLSRLRAVTASFGALPRRAVLAMLGVGGVAAAAIAIALLLPSVRPPPEPVATPPPSPRATIAAQSPVQRAEAILAQTLRGLRCTWLSTEVSQDGDGVRLAITGTAKDWFEADAAIEAAFRKAGVAITGLSPDVVRADSRDCAAIEVYRDYGGGAGGRLIRGSQTNWEIVKQPEPMKRGGQEIENYALMLARVRVEPGREFALIALNEGDVSLLAAGTPDQAMIDREVIKGNDDHSYSISLPWNTETVWGFVLVTGTGPFPRDVVRRADGETAEQWAAKFRQAADGRWHTESIWYAVVPAGSAGTGR